MPAKYAAQFSKIKLFTIDEVFGGWEKAQETHFEDGGTFDQIYAKMNCTRGEASAMVCEHIQQVLPAVLRSGAGVFARVPEADRVDSARGGFHEDRDAELVGFWQAVAAPRVVASYQLSFGASLVAALINAVFGFLLAWALVRYTFRQADC